MENFATDKPRHSLYEFNVSLRVSQDGNVDVEVLYGGRAKNKIASWSDAPNVAATILQDHLIGVGDRRPSLKKPTRQLFEDEKRGSDTFPFCWLHRIFGSEE